MSQSNKEQYKHCQSNPKYRREMKKLRESGCPRELARPAAWGACQEPADIFGK